MAGYQHAGPDIECYGRRPTSPGVPTIEQFHGMLLDAIKRYSLEPADDGFETPIIEGLEAALALFEGYFGIFSKSKEE